MMENNTYRLLVVDDIPDNLALVCEIFEDEPVELVTAASAAEALDRVNAAPPDVAILDIQMPDTNGYDLCRRLRERFGRLDVPILFLTAERTDAESIAHGLGIGACDYITKPFSAQELKARVRSLLNIRDEHRSQIAATKKLTRRLLRS